MAPPVLPIDLLYLWFNEGEVNPYEPTATEEFKCIELSCLFMFALWCIGARTDCA